VAAVNANEKKHILIVEDDESLRFLLESKLILVGFNVSVAVTAKHASQKLRSAQKFDLVLCDLKMPVMSGTDLYREYRELGLTAPFLIITGYPEKDKIMEAVKLGIQDVILKPIKHLDLIERIRVVLAAGELAKTGSV
jgi:DNA-binding NtrC family response regulator